MSLRAAAASEWIKLRTVRSTVATLAATFVLCVGLGALISFGRGSHASSGGFGGFVIDPTRVSLQGFAFAEIAIGVIGVLVISSEYATGSIRSTLAATPRRLTVLAAKGAVLFAATLVVGELCAVVSFYVGQAVLRAEHASSATLSSPGALRAVVLAGLSLALLAVFAMGIGTMLRHTAAAICLYVALLLVTFLIVAALPTTWRSDTARFLPEVLTESMRAATTGGSDFDAFGALTSTVVLCTYTIASCATGAVLFLRRDA